MICPSCNQEMSLQKKFDTLPAGFPRKWSEPTQKMGFWDSQGVWNPSFSSLNAAKAEKQSPDDKCNKEAILNVCSKVEKYQGNVSVLVPAGAEYCGSRNAFGRCSGCGIELTGEVHCYLPPAQNQMELKLSKDLPEDTFHSQVM